MLSGKPYNRSHFEALLPPGQKKRLLIDDSGVWPDADYKKALRLGLLQEYAVLSWKPVLAYGGAEPAPDSKSIPALPFPFDARDLAAFMLAGLGSFVAEFYGEWKDGPDEDALAEIDPGDSYARQSVREAFNAYREAESKVGEMNTQATHVTDAGRTLERAQAKVEDPHQTWLKAMVRQLLQPAPAQNIAVPAPVVAASGVTPDPERRLALLRSFGGTANYKHGEWKFTGIGALVAHEKVEGRKRSTEKTIRADLKEAAQNERDASRAGFATGLGQR